MINQPVFRMTIRAKRDAEIPVITRLRRLLKIMGRGYGFECVEIEQVHGEHSNDGLTMEADRD